MLNKERKSIEKVSKTILDKLYPHLFTFKIQKIFKCVINFPQFLSRNSHFNIVLASKEVPFGYRMSLKGIKKFEVYAHYHFRQVPILSPIYHVIATQNAWLTILQTLRVLSLSTDY